MKRNRYIVGQGIMVMMAAVFLLLSGCSASGSANQDWGASSSMAASYHESSATFEEDGEMADMAAIVQNTSAPEAPIPQGDYPRKIIRDAELNLETKDFPAALDAIASLAEEFDGYVQESNVSGASLYDSNRRQTRSARFVLRIAASQLDTFLERIGEVCNISRQNITAEDVSDHYYDTKSRLKSMRIREERLLEMLQQAGELKDLLEIEKELAEVRYEIESLETTIKRLDSQVSFSTVTLFLDEVVEYTDTPAVPTSLGERVANAFQESWRNFADFCIELLLTLIILAPMIIMAVIFIGVVVLVVWLVIRMKKRKKASVRPYTKPTGPLTEKPGDTANSIENQKHE